ncbi:MAG: ATP synthase F1 subunit gamma [Bacteroidetes bacterium]|nr:ATP synthase F1 subunit gamma [Bacteroidota bacterium]
MANLKEIRSRISSTISTQQITKAMKLVSATKLRRATEGIVRMRPYAAKLKEVMANLEDSVEDEALSRYFSGREAEKILLVVISSDRGLCGAFNTNVIRRTRSLIEEKYQAQYRAGNVTMLPIGKKAYEFFRRYKLQFEMNYIGLFANLNADSVFEAGDWILNAYMNGTYDRVELVYNQFKNAATQILTNEVFLPVEMSTASAKKKNDYIFEPGKVAILQELIPRSLKTQLYRAILDSHASEHGARMVAMDKATDNAGELLRSLRLAYNQARQAAITREISEIVGGAAALQG